MGLHEGPRAEVVLQGATERPVWLQSKSKGRRVWLQSKSKGRRSTGSMGWRGRLWLHVQDSGKKQDAPREELST